ncbi:MAG TPA: glycosyltransferase [Bdellovibrionota bacterium]
MKLALLSPTYPPKICGVGDHSYFLSAALQKLGHEVLLHRQLEPDLLTSQNPDALLIQYTPYLYGHRRGLPESFFHRLKRIKASCGLRIVLLAHELHYPIQLSLPGLLLGPIQKWNFERLATLSDRVLFTYARPAEGRATEKFSWLPVGSNIPRVAKEGEDSSPFLLHFGGAHPTHQYDFVAASSLRIREKFGDSWKVLCIGITEDELRRWTAPQEGLSCLGRLPAEEVSRWIARSTMLLAPFLDGISTRRGSAMAALSHGKPLVTTRGSSTDPALPWDDFTFVAKEGDADTYAECVADALGDEVARRRKATAAAAYYEKHFSWASIASALAQRISS